eukprot:gene5885-33456_t
MITSLRSPVCTARLCRALASGLTSAPPSPNQYPSPLPFLSSHNPLGQFRLAYPSSGALEATPLSIAIRGLSGVTRGGDSVAVRRLRASQIRSKQKEDTKKALARRASSVSGEQAPAELIDAPDALTANESQASDVQANKYQILDESGQLVALMAEDETGIGNAIGRQLLRTRRSFTSTVFSADGSQILFRVRRPAYLISSTMFIEDGAGNPVGEM